MHNVKYLLNYNLQRCCWFDSWQLILEDGHLDRSWEPSTNGSIPSSCVDSPILSRGTVRINPSCGTTKNIYVILILNSKDLELMFDLLYFSKDSFFKCVVMLKVDINTPWEQLSDWSENWCSISYWTNQRIEFKKNSLLFKFEMRYFQILVNK